jgi:hypothetical protein
MDDYGRIAGQMALATERDARFEVLAVKALPASALVEPTGNSGAEATADADRAPARGSDSESAT